MLTRHATLGRMKPPILRDGDLLLRPKRASDADAITAACQDAEIPRWTRVPAPYSRADAERFIAESEQEAASGTALNLLAVDARDGRLLGSVGLMGLDRAPGYAEVGYWIAAEARGRGVATRAVRLLTEWGVRELRLTRVELLTHADNAASRRVAEKAGFLDTGELRGEPPLAVHRLH